MSSINTNISDSNNKIYLAEPIVNSKSAVEQIKTIESELKDNIIKQEVRALDKQNQSTALKIANIELNLNAAKENLNNIKSNLKFWDRFLGGIFGNKERVRNFKAAKNVVKGFKKEIKPLEQLIRKNNNSINTKISGYLKQTDVKFNQNIGFNRLAGTIETELRNLEFDLNTMGNRRLLSSYGNAWADYGNFYRNYDNTIAYPANGIYNNPFDPTHRYRSWNPYEQRRIGRRAVFVNNINRIGQRIARIIFMMEEYETQLRLAGKPNDLPFSSTYQDWLNRNIWNYDFLRRDTRNLISHMNRHEDYWKAKNQSKIDAVRKVWTRDNAYGADNTKTFNKINSAQDNKTMPNLVAPKNTKEQKGRKISRGFISGGAFIN